MKKQSGATLVEVLIALVVFAVGVGGMAGLQLRSLSMSIDSTQRTVVLAKTQDLADRMRSNRRAISTTYSGVYSRAFCAVEPAENCADSNRGGAVSCTADQMAAFDLWDVFCRADSGMEGAVVDWQTQVTCTNGCANLGDQVTISVNWVSRTVDTNNNIDNTVAAGVDPTQDNLILRFIP